MTPSPPRRTLVVGRNAAPIAARVRTALPALTIDIHDPTTAGDFHDVECLIGFRVPANLPTLPRLRWVQSTGAGVDALLRDSRIGPSVAISRVTDGFGPMMAEYVACRCLMIAQGVDRMVEQQRSKAWTPWEPRPVGALSVAVVGVGAIGAAIARGLARLGCAVTGVSREGRPVEGVDRVVPVSRLDDAIHDVDVLVLVLPHTPDSEHLIGRDEIERLAQGAWIVNVARGAVIDETALIDALRCGRLGGAALDVFAEEPLPESSPLWEMRNVWVSPHVAGVTTPEQAAGAFVANYRRVAAGLPLDGEVDRARGY